MNKIQNLVLCSVPPMLKETFEFLEKRKKEYPSYKYEVIVVSDGSVDNTAKVVEDFVNVYGCDKIRCLELIENRGKGGAVQLVCTTKFFYRINKYIMIVEHHY